MMLGWFHNGCNILCPEEEMPEPQITATDCDNMEADY